MALRLDDLVCGYPPGRPVLGRTAAALEPGTFVAVIGRNGAGKSTLLRTVAGLLPALGGRVILHGENVGAMGPRDRARQIAVVTTDRVSSPGLRAWDVVALGRQPFTGWRGRLSDADTRTVRASFAAAGAERFANALVDTLSDGERQRVMIARALAQAPRLMVLDEITAFLDLPGRVEILGLLRRQARETGALVLVSSHELELSLELADRVWLVDRGAVLEGRPGELIGRGAIGQAFDTGDVRFDDAQRRFRTTGAEPTGSP